MTAQLSHVRKVLVVLSGGQDSTTCLFWAKKYLPGAEIHALTFDYGQRHRREIEAARAVALLAGVASHEVVELGAILKGTSPLTDPNQHLEQYPSFSEMEQVIGDRVEKTFVPMRNALFMVIAANRAAVLGVNHLITGVCQEDNANYPDCRRSFIDATEYMVDEALGQQGETFTIFTPLMYLSKADSVLLSQHLEGAYTALAWTHTAYDGQYPPLGSDHATVLRAHGFETAGLPDPLVVRAWMEGLMPLPATPNYSTELVDPVAADIDRASVTLRGLMQ